MCYSIAELTSIGMIATQFSRTVEQCRDAATIAGVRPVLTLNGVAYFDRGQVARLSEALNTGTTMDRDRSRGSAIDARDPVGCRFDDRPRKPEQF